MTLGSQEMITETESLREESPNSSYPIVTEISFFTVMRSPVFVLFLLPDKSFRDRG